MEPVDQSPQIVPKNSKKKKIRNFFQDTFVNATRIFVGKDSNENNFKEHVVEDDDTPKTIEFVFNEDPPNFTREQRDLVRESWAKIEQMIAEVRI